MADGKKRDGPPLTEDRDGPLGEKGWHAGATFFEESGGRPAKAAGASESRQGAGGGDPHIPASEAGTGMIPEDEHAGGGGGDVHRPASEADSGELQDERTDSPQAWPGKSFGTIPPPG